MNFEALKGFLAVCRHGSFTEAAKALFLTQPAVSQQVRSLENELGVKLIVKQGKKLNLTPAGEEVLAGAEEVFRKLEQMNEAVDDIKGLRKGRLSVAAGDTVVMYLFPQWLKKFHQLYPGIKVYLTGHMSVHVEAMVLQGECDLGLITLPVSSADLVAEVIREEPLCAVLPKDDPLGIKRRVELRHLATRAQIALGRGSATRRLIESEFASKGIEWPPLMELGAFEMIKRYVSAGFGAAIIPRMALNEHEGYIFRDLPKTFPKQELGLVHRKGQYISKPLKDLIEIIKKG